MTRKQVSKLKKALAKQGLKLPKPGWCTITTKVGGKYRNTVASSAHSTSEVCHAYINGKVKYVMHASPRRSRY